MFGICFCLIYNHKVTVIDIHGLVEREMNKRAERLYGNGRDGVDNWMGRQDDRWGLDLD